MDNCSPGINLKGHLAFISGGSGNIARFMVRTLAGYGADVAINYHKNEAVANALVEEVQAMGQRAMAIQGDVTSEESVAQMKQKVNEVLGKPDILIANALSPVHWKNVLDSELSEYQEQFDCCVAQVVLLSKAFVPDMVEKGWGRVIGISTECVMLCDPTSASYVSGKVGAQGVLRVLMHEWPQVVKMHYNHPCVVTWTPINESWGVPAVLRDKKQQQFTEAVYHLTKALDATRPVIANDGWEHTLSDILTLHDYEEFGEAFFERYSRDKDAILAGKTWPNKDRLPFAEGYRYSGQPIIISEYGGSAFDAETEGKNWGYGNGVPDAEAWLQRIDSMTSAILRLPYVCGFCYTQTANVQQEVNGLLDAHHAFKADAKRLHDIFAKKQCP